MFCHNLVNNKALFCKVFLNQKKKHFLAQPRAVCQTPPLTEELILFLHQLQGTATSKQLNLSLSLKKRKKCLEIPSSRKELNVIPANSNLSLNVSGKNSLSPQPTVKVKPLPFSQKSFVLFSLSLVESDMFILHLVF